MSLQIRLDNQLFNDPSDWDTIATTIQRDEETDALLVFQNFPLTYFNEAYDYFVSLKEQYGFCREVDIECLSCNQSGQALGLLFKGKIFLSDCEFNEGERKVTVKVVDNSYYATINNNKSIKTTVSAGVSKNMVPIDPAKTYTLYIYDLENIGRKTCYAVSVYEAFKYLVAFMSDGKIGFKSDSFNFGGVEGTTVITSGDKLSSTDPDSYVNPPIIDFSFTTLFQEIKKRIPIAFTIEEPYTNPVLRLEVLSYFFKSNSTVKFEYIDTIRTKFDANKLYSIIKFGNKVIDREVGTYFPEDINFLGFKEEEFHVLGTCNIDKTLDLSCEWVVSSNVINAALGDQTVTPAINQDHSYDQNLFLIDVVPINEVEGRTKNTNFLNLDPGIDPHVYFYNEKFTNYRIAQRYLGSIPNSIASFFGPIGNGLFKAIQAPDSIVYVNTGPDTIGPYIYNAAPYNNGGYFNLGSNRFTPALAGVFDFDIKFRINVSLLYGTGIVYWYMRLLQYDSTGNLITAYYPLQNGNLFVPAGLDGMSNPVPDRYYFSYGQVGTFDLIGKQRVVMNEGDYLEVEFDKSPYAGDVDYQFLKDFTYWSCIANTTQGGVVQDYANADYPIEQHIFSVPMTKEDFALLVVNPLASFEFFSYLEFKRYAWIQSMVYDHNKNHAEVTLFTDRNSQSNANRISG